MPRVNKQNLSTYPHLQMCSICHLLAAASLIFPQSPRGKAEKPCIYHASNSLKLNLQIFIVGIKTRDWLPEHHAHELQPCLANSTCQYVDS